MATITISEQVEERPDDGDPEVDMTHEVALSPPARLSRMYVAVHRTKTTAPSMDERLDAITYFFAKEMFQLN